MGICMWFFFDHDVCTFGFFPTHTSVGVVSLCWYFYEHDFVRSMAHVFPCFYQTVLLVASYYGSHEYGDILGSVPSPVWVYCSRIFRDMDMVCDVATHSVSYKYRGNSVERTDTVSYGKWYTVCGYVVSYSMDMIAINNKQ